jgi:hypothetical protein
MNLKSLSIAFLVCLIISIILLPILMGASIIGLTEEDTFVDEDDFLVIHNFSVTWMTIPVTQMPVLLGLGLSMFTLFVVYLGGRSKHRRFNDRTIDAVNAVNILKADFLKTARLRAVFNFLFFDIHPQEVRSNACK